MSVRVVRVESVLDALAPAVWELMCRLDTFLYVCRGVLGVPAMRGRHETAEVGRGGEAWIFLFHAIPLHRHHIQIVEVDPAEGVIRTEEHGGLVRAWRHTLHVEAVGEGRSRYSDTVEIDAGWLTPVVAAFARLLYRYRHRRWRRLVARR